MQWLNDVREIPWQALALDWGLKLVAACLIFTVGLRLARAFAGLVDRALTRAHVEATATQFLRKVVYVALLVLLVLTVLSVFNVPMTSAFAVLGAAGLAIGLALKDSLSNIASGVMLVTLKPFRVGDVVTVNGESGRVEEISIFQTRLRGSDHQTIVLPNSLVTTHSIINMTPDTMRRVEIVIVIAYDADLDAARAVALGVMHADPRVLAEPAPDVRVYALTDTGVSLGLRCHAANDDWFNVKSDVLERVKKGFDAAGIDIATTQRDLHLFHHAAAAVPPVAPESDAG